MLFVDGYMVTEFSGQPPSEAYTNITQGEAVGGATCVGQGLLSASGAPVAGAQASAPPSYDDLYGACAQ